MEGCTNEGREFTLDFMLKTRTQLNYKSKIFQTHTF